MLYMSARFLSDPRAHGGVTNKQKVFIADFLEEMRGFWGNAGQSVFFKSSQKSIGLVIPIY